MAVLYQPRFQPLADWNVSACRFFFNFPALIGFNPVTDSLNQWQNAKPRRYRPKLNQ